MDTLSPRLDGAYVVFNNIGFRHLIRKAKVRSKKEQIKRFTLLSSVPEILENPNVAVSYRVDLNGNHLVHYWALIGEKNGIKIKFIVRQVGNGVKHFYSVMEV